MKKTLYNKFNTKVSNLEKKIPDATTIIHINQHKTDKQTQSLVLFCIQKLVKLRIKFLMLVVYLRKHIMMLKYQTMKGNILLLLIIVNAPVRYLMQGQNKKNQSTNLIFLIS